MSDIPVSTTRSLTGSEIAIVGMAGRFPGAATMEQFWINLRDGVESIRPVGGERFERPAVGPDPRTLPGYVDAAGVLDDVDGFDAPFFNYTPAEAEIMDPQHRLFLECAWEALEDAGCVPDGADARIGVFAGARADTYIYNLVTNARLVQDVGPVEIGLGHDAGFLTSRVSHRLGLTGPSYAVHTACSTSLVAVHLACQSLLIDECRIALAGGVSVMVPHRSGYLYQRGGIVSSDGHCRPFDARAAGTVFTSGIGVVALKRLEDALEDGDRIHAVILGSAINNDGAAKAGFTAPAVDGQADVIAEALASADVRAESISYVEAHGTGTPLGDPIEVRALTRAFNAHTTARGFCALGSVKGNIGHLDAAAGIAGLIKTVLAMTHRTLPPTVHFIEPNPQIDFDGSPFIVQARATEWTSNGSPRRAGISSFGVGGTNAHVILEEAPASASATRSASTPAAAPAEEAEREWHVLTVSARSETALDAATDRLAAHLLAHPDQPIADVACTLQTGRRAFAHRRIVVCRDTESAAAWLERRDGPRVATGSIGDTEPVVTFLLPGQGAQYPGMGAELYASEAIYREHVRRALRGPSSGCWIPRSRSRRCSPSNTRWRSSGDRGASNRAR
jgi:phthiocerol/phenolphthiocerol synthesis type-I polyketide synthase E